MIAKDGRPSLDDEDEDLALQQRIEALARDQGIPSLTPAPAQEPVRKGDVPGKNRPALATKSIKIEMPDYLFHELSIAAATKGVTKKYLILMALKAAGYRIDNADLEEDGRRNR
jgi:hypothetical protein